MRIRIAMLIVCSLTAVLGRAAPAVAETYPSKPVHIVVGLAAGGGVDILARLMGQWLSERLGAAVCNREQAGRRRQYGTEAVVKSPPDGHTLLLVNAANAINTSLYGKLSFNFGRDIVAVGGIARQPQVMLVNPSFPATSILEFLTYAKANRGKINMGSAGIGTPSHLAGELFEMLAGVDLVHVPYRGVAPALTDLIGGQVQVLFTSTASSLEYIRSGKVRALAVLPAKRLEVLPDVPALAEFVPGYEASQWYGLGAPRATPVDVVNRLNKEINAALADPKIKSRLQDLGGVALPGSPADFARLIADETKKWGRVIQAAGLKPL